MAAKKKLIKQDDKYYAALLQAKVAAGLSLEMATEVVARQRKEDDANGLEAEADEETPAG